MMSSLSSNTARPPTRDNSGTAISGNAETQAEAFLRDLGVLSPEEIDPRLFAECLDIKVKEAQIEGFEGCLLRFGNFGTILYSARIKHETRVRFTIAHELGHWILHPGQSQGFLCTEENVARYKGSPMEAEANAFAGALLIPRFMLGRRSLKADDFLATTLSTATEFNASVMATAKRLLDLTPTPSLVVFSDGERVRWSWCSRGASHVFLRAGTAIDPDCTAYECSDISEVAVRIGLIENSGEHWFPEDFKRERITVREQSFRLFEDIVATYMEVRVD